MYEVWYEYIKHKYENNTELCYMDTDSFVHSQTEDFYKDIPDDVKKKIWYIKLWILSMLTWAFNTWNNEITSKHWK